MAEISILIPVYNAENYLAECLESIKKQTFNDYEVLIIDDGSSDNSAKICEEYSQKDPRFFVRHQENQGAGSARTAALEWARETDSRFIVWVDADDVVSPVYLQILYDAILQHSTYNIVQCSYTDRLDYLESDGSLIKKSYKIDTEEQMIFELVSGKHGIDFTVLWNKIYKKELYNNIRVESTNEISGKIHNDVNMLWRVYFNSKNCYVIENTLYYYRNVTTSIQHKKTSVEKLEVLPLYECIYKACRKKGYETLADYISERMLFMLMLHLNHPKSYYQDYEAFYQKAKQWFWVLRKRIQFRCIRPDMKLLYISTTIWFKSLRIYGLLYSMVKKINLFE